MSKTKTNETVTNQPIKTKEDLFADSNYTQKTGHLTKDPELVKGGQFVKFRIASNKEYLDGSEVKTIVNYFNILVSQNLTDAFETAQTFKKGDWVFVKGEDHTRSIDTIQGYKDTAVTTFAYHVGLRKLKGETANDTEDQTTDQQLNGNDMEPA